MLYATILTLCYPLVNKNNNNFRQNACVCEIKRRDNLNGYERAVSFDILQTGKTAEVVHSLAKWKRYALRQYGFPVHKGLYTDMNAIRRDEVCDALHSIYVDQWDWEKVITAEDRTREYLQETVKRIYGAIRETAAQACERYGVLKNFLSLFINTSGILFIAMKFLLIPTQAKHSFIMYICVNSPSGLI